MVMAAQAGQALTTLQIQQKLEENHECLVKIVAANQRAQQGQLDPAMQAQVESWSGQLQRNLMELAGQADKAAGGAAAGQQPQAGLAMKQQ